jgi:hypothetical protein
MSSAPTLRRFPIRYAIQRWNDGIWLYGTLFVVLIALTLIQLVMGKTVLGYLPVLVFDAFILAAFWIARLTSYLQISDDTLRIQYVLRRVDLPYSAVTRVRRQPLEVAFQPAERRRLANRFVRRLAREPAVYIRLDKRNVDVVANAERRLGQRLVYGADIVLPIVDVDTFISEMKQHLRLQAGV